MSILYNMFDKSARKLEDAELINDHRAALLIETSAGARSLLFTIVVFFIDFLGWASIAEIDALDNRQQAVIGVCMISNDRSYLDKQYSLVEALVLEYTELELINMSREWL